MTSETGGPTPTLLDSEYAETYFDHDMGHVSMRYSIQHHGQEVQIALTVEGYDLTYLPPLGLHSSIVTSGEVPEGDGRRRRGFRAVGVLETVYADRPLARVRLENGAPQYFDLATRHLVRADLFHEWRPVPGFDSSRDDHVKALIDVVQAMARLIVPASAMPRARVGDPPHPFTVDVEGLPEWHSLWAQHYPVEPGRGTAVMTFGGCCPPEHHEAMRALMAFLETAP